jgi:hypothetical protein
MYVFPGALIAPGNATGPLKPEQGGAPLGYKVVLNGPVNGMLTGIVIGSAPKRIMFAIFTPAS